MNCNNCGRELRQDSKFCDNCGAIVQQEWQSGEAKSELNLKLLFSGILLSAIITLLISGISFGLGLPLVFGGLFLPFFFMRKKVKH